MEKSWKTGKKWLLRTTLLLCCALLITLVAVFGAMTNASATEAITASQTITVTSLTGEDAIHRGEEFSVDIAIGNNGTTGMQSIRLLVTYDTSAMTLIGYEGKNPKKDETSVYDWSDFKGAGADKSGGYRSYGTKDRPFVLLWSSSAKFFGDGVIATLKFESKANAEIGTHSITVCEDVDNTLLSYDTKTGVSVPCRFASITGGDIEMLRGANSVELLNYNGTESYAYLENNQNPVSLEDAWALKKNIQPVKPSDPNTNPYTYKFISWKPVENGVEMPVADHDHLVFAPVYEAVPRPYSLTLMQGIELEGNIYYLEEGTPDDVRQQLEGYLGASYQYKNKSLSVDYASILPFEAYKPQNATQYTFYGWYTDAACTTPVDYFTMPMGDRTLYGCYRLNVDPDDVTTTKLGVRTEIANKRIVATVYVKENFGFDSLRFSLTYDADLTFEGFRYLKSNVFYGKLSPTFPEINDDIVAGADVTDTLQAIAPGKKLNEFYFQSVTGNVAGTGDLISFEFTVADTVAAKDAKIGIVVDEFDVTRREADYSVWYTNAVTEDVTVFIRRMAKPTTGDQVATFNRANQSYTFAEGETPDVNYCELTNPSRYDVGTETVIATLRDLENTYLTWTDGSIAPWSATFGIETLIVSVPEKKSGVTYYYTGNEQNCKFADELDTDSYTVDNPMHTAAGENYEVKIHLKDDENTMWSDETTGDITLYYTILPQPVRVPVPTGSYEYTGKQEEFAFDALETSLYTVSDRHYENAGSGYQVTLSLKDKTNYVWDLGEGGTTEEDRTFAFTVSPKKLAKPTPVNPDPVEYTGDPQEYEFIQILQTQFYTVTDNLKQTDAGTYDIVFSLKNATNTVWADESTADLHYSFKITKKVVTAPRLSDKKYNGYPQIADVYLSDDDPYIVTANEPHTEKNEYFVEFTLKDSKNYAWDDAENESDTKLVPYSITAEANAWDITPYVTNKTYDGAAIKVSNATTVFGDDVTIEYRLINDPKGDKAYTTDAPTNAGSYYVRFSAPAGESYSALETRLSFRIEKVRLTIPTKTELTYVYDGKDQTYQFKDKGNTDHYTVSGNVRKDAGTYANENGVCVAINEKDLPNYMWADGSTSAKYYDFIIEKKPIAMPTVSTKRYVYNGEAQTYEFDESGDVLQYIVTNGSRKNAGNYVGKNGVIVSLTDKANTCWTGGGTDDLSFDFIIEKKSLTVPTASKQIYVYNGKEQIYEFDIKGNTERYTVTGNVHTDPGVYSVYVSINEADKANYKWSGDVDTDDLRYSFEIRKAALTNDEESQNVSRVSISSDSGFGDVSQLHVLTSAPAKSDREFIETAKKVGALGQMEDAVAEALVTGKCAITAFSLNVMDAISASQYTYSFKLTKPYSGVVVVCLDKEKGEVKVFDTVMTTENEVTFRSDSVHSVILLADHIFDREITEDKYLKSAATCEEAAVYYRSCSCGLSAEGREDVEPFVSGEPLGHDYDFENIEWIWAADHLSVTAVVFCNHADPITNEKHFREFEARPSVVAMQAPRTNADGFVDRKAEFEFGGKTYTTSEYDREELPATGHVYSSDPEWTFEEGVDNYVVTATFTCDCGEKTVVKDALVTYEVKDAVIVYSAEVVFNGVTYSPEDWEIARPRVIFDFNDLVTPAAQPAPLVPGDKVAFYDVPAREGYLFNGWRENDVGTLIQKDAMGEYFEYRIGFKPITTFTAQWISVSTVSVRVFDDEDQAIVGAKVELYKDDQIVATFETTAAGNVTFKNVVYGNYRLDVTYKTPQGETIIRTGILDVDVAEVGADILLPYVLFNTEVEGDGSAVGLETVISKEERESISSGTASGIVNKIEIKQIRDKKNVDEGIKQQMITKMRYDSDDGDGEFLVFYDVTIKKTTTISNGEGGQYTIPEDIKVSEGYQTNIFEVNDDMLRAIALRGVSTDNIFVYKRHVSETGAVSIQNLPKVDESEGEDAEYECYYIKKVAGLEYIAVRQKEYSVLAFGVSSDPILLTNDISSLSLKGWTFGNAANKANLSARYGASQVRYTYSTEESGIYTEVAPQNAGTYYLKAYIPATDTYAAAEKITSFSIAKKIIARPAADTNTFVYNGSEQTYALSANGDYTIVNASQTEAGKYVVSVSLKDVSNMVWDSGLGSTLSYDFVIEKKKLSDIEGITFEDKSFYFNGKEHSLAVSGDLPSGVEVVYDGNAQSDLGRYIVRASFIVSNPNYEATESMSAVMTIKLWWIPIAILAGIVLLILIIVIVIVEKLLKKHKGEGTPPNDDAGGGADAQGEEGGQDESAKDSDSDEGEDSAEEGTNND